MLHLILLFFVALLGIVAALAAASAAPAMLRGVGAMLAAVAVVAAIFGLGVLGAAVYAAYPLIAIGAAFLLVPAGGWAFYRAWKYDMAERQRRRQHYLNHMRQRRA